MTLGQFFTTALLVLEMHFERLKYAYAALLVLTALFAGGVWFVFFAPPSGFPANQIITVVPGESGARVARELREAQAVNSTFLLRSLLRLMPPTQAGKYVFSQPVGILTVAWNLTHGISGIPTTKLTFPEGTTVRQMGAMLAHALPGFDEQVFDSIAIPDEGYLFPDTYFFLPATTPAEAKVIMEANYHAHVDELKDDMQRFGKSEREVLTMASLLEGEGKTLEDKRMISGILWHRIAMGMRLQVDAPFGYIYGVTGYTPTSADLKSNSAYNTYRYAGLPPTPINNPGDESIMAAITPTTSAYLYYLTGDDGKMHYAKTFAEHVANQKRYFK